MVLLVAHVDESECIGADSPRVVELPVSRPLATKSSQEMTAGVKYLYPVVVSIGDDVLSDTIDSDSGEAVEFSLSVAVAS